MEDASLFSILLIPFFWFSFMNNCSYWLETFFISISMKLMVLYMINRSIEAGYCKQVPFVFLVSFCFFIPVNNWHFTKVNFTQNAKGRSLKSKISLSHWCIIIKQRFVLTFSFIVFAGSRHIYSFIFYMQKKKPKALTTQRNTAVQPFKKHLRVIGRLRGSGSWGKWTRGLWWIGFLNLSALREG